MFASWSYLWLWSQSWHRARSYQVVHVNFIKSLLWDVQKHRFRIGKWTIADAGITCVIWPSNALLVWLTALNFWPLFFSSLNDDIHYCMFYFHGMSCQWCIKVHFWDILGWVSFISQPSQKVFKALWRMTSFCPLCFFLASGLRLMIHFIVNLWCMCLSVGTQRQDFVPEVGEDAVNTVGPSASSPALTEEEQAELRSELAKVKHHSALVSLTSIHFSLNVECNTACGLIISLAIY